jgi:hypothetical protein
MNFRQGGRDSVILMGERRGAPYADRVEENGRVLIYEGHDVARTPKLAVWKRDGGKCIQYGSRDNLRFDYIIPFSLGGFRVDSGQHRTAVCQVRSSEARAIPQTHVVPLFFTPFLHR